MVDHLSHKFMQIIFHFNFPLSLFYYVVDPFTPATVARGAAFGRLVSFFELARPSLLANAPPPPSEVEPESSKSIRRLSPPSPHSPPAPRSCALPGAPVGVTGSGDAAISRFIPLTPP